MKILSELDLTGKRVLYRVDINSAVEDGKIVDDMRLQSIVPTIQNMQEMGAQQIVFLAHQGRPGKDPEGDFSLRPHAQHLSQLLGQEVLALDTCQEAPPESSPLVMMGNVRLDDETNADENTRLAFAERLAQFGDVYVNDAFGVCHRHHTSVVELPKLMKEKAAGLLLEKEIRSMKPLLDGDIKHPFTVIIGGAKIDTKIGIINQFLDSANHFLLGGGIANTFLHAEGYDVGESLKESDKVKTAQEIALQLDGKKDGLVLPTDVVCADEPTDTCPAIDIPVEDVMGDMKIFDIGERTAQKFAQLIEYSNTVIWNGPVGFAEKEHFRKGSQVVAEAMVRCHGKTIVGGGESVGVINSLGIPHKKFTHVSTGGGAMLEFLSGKQLPGIVALQ